MHTIANQKSKAKATPNNPVKDIKQYSSITTALSTLYMHTVYDNLCPEYTFILTFDKITNNLMANERVFVRSQSMYILS